jgi:Domain of unknown function (DU1801)
MDTGKAQSVADFLAGLPEERRRALAAVRARLRKSLPKGYAECMQSGMIAYVIPLERFSGTHNGAPLLYAALAAQKNHMAVYLMGLYADPELRDGFEKAYRASGKRLDAGKACVRFAKLDDLPLDVVGDAVARLSVDAYLALYQNARTRTKPNNRVQGGA